MVRMENILPSPSLYHIEVTENRMLCYVTSSRKKKNPFVLTATYENMEDLGEYSKFLLVLHPNSFLNS